MIKLSLLMFSFLCLIGCEHLERRERVKDLNEKGSDLNANFGGKTFALDSTAFIALKPVDKVDVAMFTIVVYYDANCSVCFEQLRTWKDEVVNFKNGGGDIDFNFFLYADDSTSLRANLEHLKFPLEYVTWDLNKSLISSYPFLDDKAFNSMLIDRNNRILFVGSPVVSKGIKQKYKSLME